MVYYVVTAKNRHTIDNFLAVWGFELAGRVKVIPYERLRHQRKFAAGAYIFTDMERTSPGTQKWATCVARELRAAGNRVLNDPGRVLSRYDLLRRLHADGRNDFCAYGKAEWDRVRYPAFLRLASEHTGSLTPLLHGPEDLAKAVAGLPADVRRDDVIAVEFIDTRCAAGVFRKYSVHRIGPYFVPRHVFFSRDWVGKYADLDEADHVDEEAAFMAGNPFDAEARAAFETAGVEYGRIDFAVLNGRLQVWEINTNARLSAGMGGLDPRRFGRTQTASRAIAAAFGELAECDGKPCQVRVGLGERRSYGLTGRDAVLATAAGVWRKCRATGAGKLAARWWSEYV